MSNQQQQLELSVEEKRQTLLRQKMRLLEEKKRLLVGNQIAFFTPHEKQIPFFEAALKPRRAAFCGNRWGKSTIGVVEDCSWLLGYRPFFPEGHPLRRLGIPEDGVKGLMIAEDWDKLHEVFTNDGKKGSDKKGKFFDFLPEWAISGVERTQTGVINKIYVRSQMDGRIRQSVMYFDTVKAFKMSGASHESSDWDFIHVDEPIPRDLWVASARGLIDRGGSSWWLLTPLKEPWMYYNAHDEETKDDWWVTSGDMDENPTLDENEKRRFLVGLTDEERQCRKKGIPMSFSNLVYPEWDERKHVFKGVPKGWTDVFTPPPSYFTAYAIDPHSQTPMAVLFVTISPKMDDGFHHVFIFDEIWDKIRVSELARQIKLRKEYLRVGYELCDPCAWIENPDTGTCWADTLLNHGLDVVRASKNKMLDTLAARDIFRSDKIKFSVMEHCTRFRFEIKHYVYDKENRPADKDDHMMENFRRLVAFDNLTYYPPSNWSKPLSTTFEDGWVNFNVEKPNYRL